MRFRTPSPQHRPSPRLAAWLPAPALGLGLGLGAALALSLLPSAQAMPTGAPLWGITGTGTLPTTETVPQRETEVGLAYEKVNPRDGEDVHFFPIGTATFGLKRAEIGLGALRERVNDPFLNQTFSTTYATLHGKYRAYQDPARRLAVAVGAHYLDFGRVPGSVLSLYAVGSKALTRPASQVQVLADVGALYNHIAGRVRDDNVRPYASLEGRRGGFSLSADYTPRAGQSVQIYSFAARYQKDRYGLQLGYGQFRGTDEKLFVGASYRFGGAR